jgi:hypothetical protein
MTKVNDPIDALLEADKQRDLSQAKRRGERVLSLVDSLIDALEIHGLMPIGRRGDARCAMFGTLADDLYGMRAVDVPPLRD